MNTIHLVTITRDNAAGALVYRFACHDDAARASYLAGECIDRLADATGDSFWYEVAALPYAPAMTAAHDVARAAVDALTES